jgi:hypothetical protein
MYIEYRDISVYMHECGVSKSGKDSMATTKYSNFRFFFFRV